MHLIHRAFSKFTYAGALALAIMGTTVPAQAEVKLSVPYPEIYGELEITGGVYNEWVPNKPCFTAFSVFNHGDEPATHVSLTQGLPPGFTIVSSYPPDISFSRPGTDPVVFPDPANPNPGYDIEVLPPGTGVVYRYQVTAQEAGEYPVTVSATCAEPEADLSDNTYTSVVHIVPESEADVSAAVSADKATVAVGEEVTLTMDLKNNGPGVASLVRCNLQVHAQVRAYVPGLEFVSASLSTGGPVKGGEGGVYLGEHPIALQSGETATITATYRAKIAGTLIVDAQVYNTVVQPDPNGANNFQVLTMPVTGYIPEFDLEAQLKMSPATVQPGGLMVEQLVVKNHGPDDATSVSLSTNFGDISIGGGILFSHDFDLHDIVDAGGWTISLGTLGLHGTLPALAAGESSTVTLVMKLKDNPAGTPGQPNRIWHSFRVQSNYWHEVGDFTTSSLYKHNSSVAEVTLNRDGSGDHSDLDVTRTAPLEVPVGTAYNYTVTARNLGPSPTSTGYLANVLPAGVKVVQAKSDKGTASVAGGFVSLEDAPLAVGETATLNITVVPEELGAKTFSGTVASSQFDPALANNGTAATTLVTEDGPVVNPDEPCVDMPDLVAKVAKVSRKGKFKKKTKQWNYKVQAKVEVTNIGTGCALDKSVVKLYLSKDTVLDSGDMLIGGKQVKKLCPPKKAGKAPKPKKVSVKAKLQPGVNPVGLYVLAVVDADGTVVECNENNNIALSLN